MEMLKEYFTWNGLTTYGGLVLAVTLITQFIKGVGFIDRIPTRFVSYVISIVVMNAALIFTASWTWSGFALAFLNAVIVSLASNGTHDGLADEFWWRVHDKIAAEEAEDGGDEV